MKPLLWIMFDPYWLSSDGGFHAVKMPHGRLEYDELDELLGGCFAPEGGHTAFTVEFFVGQSGDKSDHLGTVFSQRL